MKYYVIPFTLIVPFMLKVDSFLGAVGLLLANIALHIMQAKSCPNVSGSLVTISRSKILASYLQKVLAALQQSSANIMYSHEMSRVVVWRTLVGLKGF